MAGLATRRARCRPCWTSWTGSSWRVRGFQTGTLVKETVRIPVRNVIFRHRVSIYTGTMVKYSIVVPFHNEEENVTVLYARLKQVMEQVGDSFELVLVDDGSNDRTYKLHLYWHYGEVFDRCALSQ